MNKILGLPAFLAKAAHAQYSIVEIPDVSECCAADRERYHRFLPSGMDMGRERRLSAARTPRCAWEENGDRDDAAAGDLCGCDSDRRPRALWSVEIQFQIAPPVPNPPSSLSVD
jgi:hypothetical protein